MLRRAWRWLREFGWLQPRPVVFDQEPAEPPACGRHCPCSVQP